MPTTWVEIRRDAILHNLRELQRRVAPARVMAVVKGNAYGHGLREVAGIVRQAADWFGVNALHEASTLANDHHRRPILILGSTPPEDAERVVLGGFRQAVYDAELLDALNAAAARTGTVARIHLKVETGTNRQGVAGAALASLAAAARQHAAVELEGLYTHYANVEELEGAAFAYDQLARFSAAVALVERCGPLAVTHTACSAAAILYPAMHCGMVRLGVSLYGLWPSAETRTAVERSDQPFTLLPALTWKCRVAQVKDVAVGESIGYGCGYVTTAPMRVAVLPVGYYEGYDRGLSGRASVLLHGRRARVLGRVCMNMCMVDVTAIPQVRAGSEAVLLGEQGGDAVPAEELAALLDTINYEVVTRIGASVPRIVV